MSNRINLTPKRLDKVRRLIRKGYSLKSVSLELRMNYETLRKKLKEINFDITAEKNIGIDILRGSVIDDIYEIEEPDKRVAAKLKYLDKYDNNNDNDNDNDAVGSSITVDEAVSAVVKIMNS